MNITAQRWTTAAADWTRRTGTGAYVEEGGRLVPLALARPTTAVGDLHVAVCNAEGRPLGWIVLQCDGGVGIEIGSSGVRLEATPGDCDGEPPQEVDHAD